MVAELRKELDATEVIRTQRRWYVDELTRLQDLTGLEVIQDNELTALSLRSRIAELDWVLLTVYGLES
jgi:hypothetical protein